MRKIELSVNSIIVISAVLVVLAGFCAAGIGNKEIIRLNSQCESTRDYYFTKLNPFFSARTEIPLKCHVCDPDTCKTFNKKAEPKVCSKFSI